MRQVATLSVALGLALGASYWTWTVPSAAPLAAEAVALYQGTPAEINALHWVAENVTVRMERKTDRLGDYTWVTVDRTLPATPPEPVAEGEDAAQSDAPPATPAPEHELTAFVGNDAAVKLWDDVGPLTALRRLDVKDLSSAAYGLDEPTATLTVTRRQGPAELTLGGESYGTKDRYVRYDNRVYLVKAATLRPLEQASARLVERALFPVLSSDVEQVELQQGTAKRTFVHRNRDDRAAAFWADASAPDDVSDVAGPWLDKLFRVRVEAYEDDIADLEPVLTFSVLGKGERWSVQLLRSTGGAQPEFYARTTYNRSLVKLTRDLAQDVVADLGAVMGAE